VVQPVTAADLHEGLLLRQAVRACGSKYELRVREVHGGWRVLADPHRSWEPLFSGNGPTLTAALTVLLRDLGVEPVEWPSAERVLEAWDETPLTGTPMSGVGYLVGLFRDEPMTALALLFGEEGS
jgi:hypothetical protein